MQSVCKAATIIDKTQVTQNPLCHQLIASDQEDNILSIGFEKIWESADVSGGPRYWGLGGKGKWNVVKANPVNIM